MPSKKGATKAAAKPATETEVQEEKPVEVEENNEEVEETKAPDAAAVKRGRGRPKKDGAEPTVKKPKKVKERTEPSRVSRRVANMKSGVTEPEIETEEPPKKTKKVSKKTAPVEEVNEDESQEESAANGTKDEVVSS